MGKKLISNKGIEKRFKEIGEAVAEQQQAEVKATTQKKKDDAELFFVDKGEQEADSFKRISVMC